MLKVGSKAPEFEMTDQRGALISTSQLLKTSKIVLFFYPKDGTPGCTKQSCFFRDNYREFLALNTVVIGISSDSKESHRDFASTFNLPFSLLSDANGRLRQLYDVKTTLGFLPGRATFVIDQNGIIRFALSSQFYIQRHIDESLAFIKSIK